MNAHTLKHIHTKFGKVAVDGLRDTAADGRTEGGREGGTDGGTEGRRDGRVTDLGHLPIVFPV